MGDIVKPRKNSRFALFLSQIQRIPQYFGDFIDDLHSLVCVPPQLSQFDHIYIVESPIQLSVGPVRNDMINYYVYQYYSIGLRESSDYRSIPKNIDLT